MDTEQGSQALLPTALDFKPNLLPEVSSRFKASADFVEFLNKPLMATKQPRLTKLL